MLYLINLLDSRNIIFTKVDTLNYGRVCAQDVYKRQLQQLGFPDEKVDTALRISFCRDNTMEDIEIFVKALKCGINSLQRIKK